MWSPHGTTNSLEKLFVSDFYTFDITCIQFFLTAKNIHKSRALGPIADNPITGNAIDSANIATTLHTIDFATTQGTLMEDDF